MELETVVAVTQVINRYGHVADNRDFDGLAEVFSADAVFDQTRTSGRILRGLDEIVAFFALGPGPERPHHSPGHHATNIYVYEEAGVVRAWSKLLAIEPGTGMPISGDYEDEFVLVDGAWRIARRVVSVRWHPSQVQGL